MKKTFLLAAAFAATFFTAGAQVPPDYRPVLGVTFLTFDTTYVDMAAKKAAGNKLQLIAKKYPGEWAPAYYAAYSRVQLSYMEPDAAKRDAYVDEAENYLADAVRMLGRETDETHVLSAMVANARMAVDGRARYQKYGKIFNDQLDSAKAINPDNPRIYLQRGIAKFYTPKMFGGGKKAATPYFEKAKELFAKEPGGNMDKPYWGQTANNYFLEQIKGDDKE